jgi:hypothetical protein
VVPLSFPTRRANYASAIRHCEDDHLLRSDESYAEKWNYVRENPVRAGLAQSAEDWPYAGEIVVIDRA